MQNIAKKAAIFQSKTSEVNLSQIAQTLVQEQEAAEKYRKPYQDSRTAQYGQNLGHY